MDKFRTEITISPQENKISHTHKLLFFGSCFSENIGQKFKGIKFKTEVNPFGILFNPISIVDALNCAVNLKYLKDTDLVNHNELWHSFMHHSRFSGLNKTDVLDRTNNSINKLFNTIKKSNWMFITLGTAWVYQYKPTGELVANCHKIPNNQFNKRLLDVKEIVKAYKSLFDDLFSINPDIKVVFTVSPVRHIKDGIIENQRSKSVLHLAVAELEELHSNVSYFPSYELVMDDLRDYRFYGQEMLHPNNQAIDYIWSKLKTAYFDSSANNVVEAINKIMTAVNHKPFNRESVQHQKFVEQQLKLINIFEDEWKIELKEEKEKLKAQQL